MTPPATPPLIAPSILSADFSRLGPSLAIVDPALDWVHCDVMDHHFVPNLTFGPLLVQAVRALTPAFVDVHLMIERPGELAEAFCKAGADQITVHLEACREPGEPLSAFDSARVSKATVRAILEQVRATGARVGLALKPATPFEAARPFLEHLDHLLVMTVEPGAGGQPFRDDMLPKIRAAAEWRRSSRASWTLQVDGGIAADTIGRAHDAGADVFVAGNAVFGTPSPVHALEVLRRAIGRGGQVRLAADDPAFAVRPISGADAR
jgi:ribulose-phosphate 3-epimerase